MKYVIGSWKMDPEMLKEAKDIFREISDGLTDLNLENIKAVICPPFVWISELKKLPIK